jgi:hypothetical protein
MVIINVTQVAQQLPESALEKESLQLELRVDLLANGPFKEAEKLRLRTMQEDCAHLILMRAASEEAKRVRHLKDPPKGKTASCLESTQKKHFSEAKGLSLPTELALLGPGCVVYEGQLEDPHNPKNTKWVHTNDCRGNSNDVRIFRILREDYENGIRKQWTEDSNGAPERTDDRGSRITRLDVLREDMQATRAEEIRQGAPVLLVAHTSIYGNNH